MFLFGLCFFVMAASAFVQSLLQERFTRKAYHDHQGIWAQIGAPGGWFWRPLGRSWIDNFIITWRFWYKNQLDWSEGKSLPLELSKIYKAYRAICLLLWVISTLVGMLGFGVHVYNLGLASSGD